MALPRPEPGLVVRYGYLWREQSRVGILQSKERPACIVASITRQQGRVRVVLLPITRSRPRRAGDAIELPPKVKAHLGLGPEQSWVVVTECNVDEWPSPDLAAVPGQPGTFAYGFLPIGLFMAVRDRFVVNAESERLHWVHREDDEP